MLSSNKICAC